MLWKIHWWKCLPKVMCHRQCLFSYVCLTHQLHTTPSKEYNVSSASAVHKSLSEVMSHLLQIVTYLISEERNRMQRQYHNIRAEALLIDKKDILGWNDAEKWRNQIHSFIYCHNMVDWRHRSVSQPASQSASRSASQSVNQSASLISRK